MTPGPRWANRESLPGDGLLTSVLCWALGGTSSGAVPLCDGYRDALGRNARVTARRVRDSPAGHPGAATTSRTAHLRSATTSGGARAATLGCCVGRGHATYVITVGGTRVVACWWSSLGVSPPLSDSAFQANTRSHGGERWLAQIFRGGQPRGGQRRRLAGSGWPGRWSWMVIPVRAGRGRGAGISANRSATSHQRSSSSCCRRIHSASTIAVASSSKAVAVWVSVAISLTPFARMLRPGPAGHLGGPVVRR